MMRKGNQFIQVRMVFHGNRLSLAIRFAAVLFMHGAMVMVLAAFEKRVSASEPTSANRLLELIDRETQAIWVTNDLTAPGLATDSVLLRRVTLDLVGRIPTEAEAREYLSSQHVDKYAEAVDRLLRAPEFNRHLATQMRRAWLPQLETQEFEHLTIDYEHWLRAALAKNTPYDELVHQQLTSPIDAAIVEANPHLTDHGSSAFLAVADMDPAKLAANAPRAFLGLNLDCAQCHDHPFSRWSRDQFWQTAAFFSRQSVPDSDDPSLNRWVIEVESTGQMVEAAFLDKTTTTRESERNIFKEGRQAFADWAVDPKNDYFAENAVNRVWKALMGRPLVAPVDDLTGIEQAAFGPLLKQLASEFRDIDYQLIPLIRAIVLSRAYRMSFTSQADGTQANGTQANESFASRPPRLVDSNQLIHSLRTASGLVIDLDAQNQSAFAKPFVIDDPRESLRSTVQSLMMMNGELVTEACDPEGSPLIRTLHEAPFLGDEDKIESLFLRTLTRYPSTAERQLFLEFIQSGRQGHAGEAQALADLLWILINTAEFHTIT